MASDQWPCELTLRRLQRNHSCNAVGMNLLHSVQQLLQGAQARLFYKNQLADTQLLILVGLPLSFN